MDYEDQAEAQWERYEARRDEYEAAQYEENSYCVDCGCEPEDFPCGCRCSHENMEVRKSEETDDE